MNISTEFEISAVFVLTYGLERDRYSDYKLPYKFQDIIQITVTLKLRLGITRGHWNRRISIRHLQRSNNVPLFT